MNVRPPSTRCRAARFAGALAFAIAAMLPFGATSCSSGEEPRGVVHMGDAVYVPLHLAAEAGATEPDKVEHLGKFTPQKGIEPWKTLGGKATFGRKFPLNKGQSTPTRPGILLEGQKPDKKARKQISIPVSLTASSLNEIVVGMRCFTRETVQLMLKREGRPVAVSEALSVDSAMRAVKFSFPKLRRTPGEIDEILITTDAPSGSFLLFDVDAFKRPITDFLPGPEPDLVSIRNNLNDARRGVGLSSKRPLVAAVEVEANTELVFCYGIPEDLRAEPAGSGKGERSGQAVLSVELSRAGQRLGTREFPLESSAKEKSEWHDATVDLAEFGAGPMDVKYTLSIDSDLEGLCLVGEARLRSRGTQAPTVLLITSDTHRADHLGSAGDLVVTPTLDALAARGIVFKDCYSATNVTNPSHVSIMTAVNPRDTRIVNNRSPLVANAQTMAEGFKAGGYRTFAALSAHHLMHDESGLGQGFDRMSAPRHADRDSSETLDILEEWVDDAEGEPLFVWLHVFDAHSPYAPPAPYSTRYYTKDQDPHDPSIPLLLDEAMIPPFLKGLRDIEFPYTQYRGEVDYLDQQLARILERERFRAGIVAFTADHGESFGQHGVYWDHAELYPDTVHIPLIMTWPGSPIGKIVETPVSALDLGRTLLDLAGLEEAPLGGRDLRTTLTGTFESAPRFLMSAHGFSSAINSGDWHLILHLRDHHQSAITNARTEHQVELYNLKSDPKCEINLVDTEFERAKRMRERLIRWLSEAEDMGLRGVGTQTREDNAQLEALGYAEGGQPLEEGAWFNSEHGDCDWCDRFE